MRALAPSLVASTFLATGCAHHVALTSAPAGAYVSLGGERVGVTPLELRVPLVGTRALHIEMVGYRPLDLTLPATPPSAIELLLVREHGGAGTWSPDDIP
jgi:hypothetical protein